MLQGAPESGKIMPLCKPNLQCRNLIGVRCMRQHIRWPITTYVDDNEGNDLDSSDEDGDDIPASVLPLARPTKRPQVDGLNPTVSLE